MESETPPPPPPEPEDPPGSPPLSAPSFRSTESSFRSVASSSSLASSFRGESFDFTRYPPQSEYEEIPSYRWLSDGEEDEIWDIEGYAPLCGHGKVGDRRVFPFKDGRGEKCLFMPAGGLGVREDEDQRWSCTDTIQHGNRSWHAVQLVEGYYLDMCGIIDTATLSSGTEYAIYLLFRFTKDSDGFVLQEAALEIGTEASTQNICLEPLHATAGMKASVPNEAVNGWLSIEMGRFSTGRSGNMKLFIKLTEGSKWFPDRIDGFTMDGKSGLVIGGVILEPVVIMDHRSKGLIQRVVSMVL